MPSAKPSDAPLALDPGFHVYQGADHNSGPYATAEDAQAFIDSHLGGKGKVVEIEASAE